MPEADPPPDERLDEDDPEATVLGADPTGPAEQIGHYRVLRKLGQGGMGEVFEADQLEPVRRKVALKIIRRGMDTDQVVHRFESERQALALMNHPNIARVFDAGATANGRPYFAMEFVRGEPITDYCNRQRLDTAQRLRLFVQVCEGVQHAHQKGIIHRDIKPSNVLVDEEEGQHLPKIIDFGIAKATAQPLTRQTFYTEMGQLLGTPEYMSPEQAGMKGEDVDTRTDVYLLGVLLYELLTGELPFPVELLRKNGLDEFRRKVQEDEPARPSTRVSGGGAEGRAQTRRTDPGSLRRRLRGDLDWIIMKALEKDRARRYASVSELARDIERHLSHEPVLASPPSRIYRLRKFVRRHKAGVAFAGVLLVLIGVFSVTMAVQRNRNAVERDRANAARVTAESVIDILVSLFRFADPHETLGDTVTARQLLDRGTDIINDRQTDPAVRAKLLYAMGSAYAGIGLRDRAIPMLEEALAIRQQIDPDSLDVANTMVTVADLVRHRDFEKAQQYYEAALAIRERQLPHDDLSVISNLERIGIMVAERGDYAGAEDYLRRAYELREEKLGPDDPGLAVSLNNWAVWLKADGRYAEAEDLLLRALRLTERHREANSPELARSHERLGNLYHDMGDFTRARDEHLASLKIRRVIFGEEGHPQLASNLMALAIDCAALGQMKEATRYHDEAEAMYRETDSSDVPFELFRSAQFAVLTGATDEALRDLQRAFVVKGFSNARTLLEDEHLKSLHDNPEFQSIVAAVKRRTGEK